MIKLTDLLKEIKTTPKAIIMAGGASVGKSTVLNTLNSLLKDFINLNADKYVEDKNSPMYGNLSAASSQIKKTDFPNAVNNRQNLIYDTTAANLTTLQPMLDELTSAGYNTMMIMVYAHPIISFLRNFKRERKVPAVGVLGTWVNVYNLLEEYKQIFGKNFILVSSPPVTTEEKQAINNFEQAYNQGTLQEYFADLLSSGEFSSTFRKDDSDLSPEELAKKAKQRLKSKEILDKTIDKISDTYESIQSKLDPIDIKELPNKVKMFVG
jgi:hypothetical protein